MSKPMDMKRASEWVNEECPGEDCPGCESSACYAMGGKVSLKQQLEDADDNTNSTPIYSTQSSASGQPQAGYGHGWNKNSDNSYSMDDYSDPKTWRKNRVAAAFAEGGKVGSGKQRYDFEKGVNKPVEETDDPKYGSWQRRSEAGSSINEMGRLSDSREEKRYNAERLQKAKDIHHKTLGQSVSMKKPNLYAEGGEVKGVHTEAGKFAKSTTKDGYSPEGQSMAGSALRGGHKEWSKDQHRRVLKESKDIKPNLYAEGGEVEMGDDEMDTALSDAACGELLESIDKKDKAGILEAIRALVLSVR